MDTASLFDIRTCYDVGIKLPQNSEGTLFLLGNRPVLADAASQTTSTVLNGMDRSMTFYDYKIRILDVPKKVVDSAGCNIICVIENPLNGKTEYITVDAEPDIIPLAITEVINEAEAALKEYYKEAIIVEALQDPDGFRRVVDKVIVNPHPWNEGDGSIASAVGGVASMLPIGGLMLGLTLGVDMDFDADNAVESLDGSASSIDEDLSVTPNSQEAALDGEIDKTHYLRNLSAKERKSRLLKLPEKVTSSLKKRDPQTSQFIKEIIENMTPAEKVAIMESLFAKHKNIAHEVMSTMIGGVSRYELLIKPRGVAAVKMYKDKVNYIMYLKDEKGNETPVVFKNAPAYCIYVMHVIDRYNNKENTRVLDLRKHKKEFCEVYAAIFDEEDDKIVKIYDELENRLTGKPDEKKKRKGRYPEYIKDIHQTFEELLGIENSIPFKVGNDRFLSLLPSKITIPSNLARLKIS